MDDLELAKGAKAGGKNRQCAQKLLEMREKSLLENREKVALSKQQRSKAQRALLARRPRYHLELGSNSLTLPAGAEDSLLELELGSKPELSKSRSSARRTRAGSPGTFLNSDAKFQV